MSLYLVIYDDYDCTNIIMEEKDYKILDLLEKYHVNFNRLFRDVVLEVKKVIVNDDYLNDIYWYYQEIFEMYGFNKEEDIDLKEVAILRERYEELKQLKGDE